MSTITKIVAPEYDVPEPKAENSLSAEQRENCRKIADELRNGRCTFVWRDTAEGEDFWKSVRDRLWAIGNGEPLR